MKDLLAMKKELQAKLDAIDLLLGATTAATTKTKAKTKTRKRRTGHVGPKDESIAAKTRVVVAHLPTDTLFTVNKICQKLNLYCTKRNRKAVSLELDRMRKRGEVVKASNPYESPAQYMKG